MGSSYMWQIYETHFIWTRAKNCGRWTGRLKSQDDLEIQALSRNLQVQLTGHL
jgi:hypothetical protein